MKRVPLDCGGKKKRLSFKRLPVEDKLLKGYNRGVEMALSALEKEFNRFEKRKEKEEKGARKF